MKVAIIDSGISGLTAAHLPHPGHEIAVFEAGDHVGGHTHTIRVDAPDGPWDVDTGLTSTRALRGATATRLTGSIA